MGLHTILKLFLFFFVFQCIFGQVWQFGKDGPYSDLIFHAAGNISPNEKIKLVEVTVPKHYNLTVVRLEVDNYASHANASFDREKKLVTISYEYWQESESTFDVKARGVLDEEFLKNLALSLSK